MSITPGWYKDPAEPTTQRWWDGEGWVGEPLPADATPPAGPPPDSPPPGSPPPESPLPDSPLPDSAAKPDNQPAQPSAHASGAGPGEAGAGRRPDSGARAEDAKEQPTGGGATGLATRSEAAGTVADPAKAPPGHPYRPAGAPPAAKPHGFPLASLGTRLVARLVDIALVLGLNVVVNGWFVYRYWNEISPAMAEIWRRGMAGETTFSDLPEVGDQAGTLQIVILIIAAALWFAYEVPAVANTGQTPGKRLLRIKVVRLEDPRQAAGGAPPSEPTEPAPLGFGRSFRRWNTMGLPTLLWWCFGLGLLLQLVDAAFAVFDRPLQQALHDKSAHTAVIAVTAPGKKKEAADAPADPS